MKHMMKSVLALVLSMAMLLVPVAANAAPGDFSDKYLLGTDAPLSVTVPAETTVYVQVTNSNGSVVDATSNVSLQNVIKYGTQIVAASGKTASFTMVAEGDWFSLYNSSTAAMTVTLTLTAGTAADTTGSLDNPEYLTLEDPYSLGMQMAVAQKTFESGSTGYWYKVIAPGEGSINVSVSACDEDYNDVGWQYCVNNETQGIYGDNHWSDDNPLVDTESVSVKKGDVVLIFVIPYNPSNMFVAPAGITTMVASFSAKGSYDCPVEAALGDNTAIIDNGNGYYYTWTATQDGVATFTMNTASNWEYCLNGIPADPEDYANYYYGETHWSDDEVVVKSESIAMQAGASLNIYVNTYNPTGAAGSGDIDWTLSFVSGEVGDDDSGDDDIEEDEETEENFNYGITLEVGSNEQAVDLSQPYTVFDFSPSETGKYTFTVADGLIGIVSYTDMWVQNMPSDSNVNASSVVWDCTSVGQGIYVAVKNEGESVSVTVEREDLVVEETVPWIYYENTVKPEAFVFNGKFDDLDYVDTFDSVNDKAVLGADGFYHLNSATGPILYVCLNDSLMNLSDAVQYGQLKEVIADEHGKVLERTDFNGAFSEIFACADVETGLYPLTADLIEMYTRIGAYQGWYGENGFIGGDLEDAWMFACYYKDGESFDGAAGNGGNTSTSPNTADVSHAMSVLVLAIAAGIVIALTSKKAFAR